MNRSRARVLRNNPTEAERLLWQHLRLRQLGGYKFRRQQSLGNYVVDFVCLGKRLIIEVDGGQHSTQAAYDEQRTTWIEQQGFRVLRFWNNEGLQNIEGVKEAIWQALTSIDPPSSILPRQGGRKGAISTLQKESP
jgi:very-short-patch-repair endonuclease